MNEIVNDGGGNQYKIPHLSKDKLEKAGWLPSVLEVSPLFAGMIACMRADRTPLRREDIDRVLLAAREAGPLPDERITRDEFSNLLADAEEEEDEEDV